MINNISIQNFAILEEMDLNFHNGLTVITGETGAGKSILLHAIRASLGGKVKGTAVRSGTDKAIVEIEVSLDGDINTCRRIINVRTQSSFF